MNSGHIFPISSFGAATGVAEPKIIVTSVHASDLKTHETETGSHVIENLRIFKVGTFTDFFGIERTWEDFHLDQMVAHYHILKNGGYFPDVPIRQDHSMSVKDLVGYFQDIYRDPDDQNFLSSTIELTEDWAWEKWERRTWRSRSIEIGMYETNDGMLLYPVVTGLAFVDIGAVEGLHARQKQDKLQFNHLITDNEETSMPPDPKTDPEGWKKAANYAKALADWETAANYAKALDDWSRAVVYAKALEDEQAANNPPGDDGKPENQPDPSQHNRPAPVATFRVEGHQTQDPMQVQHHIDTLEQFRRETTDSNRTSFVEQLATDKKIAASQIDDLSKHALSLTDEQFSSFRATYENAPELSIFSGNGNQHEGETPPVNNDGTPAPDELETAKEIVAQHRRSGMDEEKIKKTASFKKLVAAGINV